jgi:hypothetical protein
MGPREASKMKKEGLEPGVPDLMVVDKGVRLALEMKSRDLNRSTSKDQDLWLDHLEGQGWETAVCWGAEEAIAVLGDLFGHE